MPGCLGCNNEAADSSLYLHDVVPDSCSARFAQVLTASIGMHNDFEPEDRWRLGFHVGIMD
jgi:hypothetical protein